MSNPCLEAVTSELAKFGIPFKTEVGGKHTHVRYGQDYANLRVIASTPSDRRAPLNERAAIRRELRALGYGDEESQPREMVPVQLIDGEPVCTSQDIAESFGKAHKDVLRAIDRVRDECGAEFDGRNFAPIEYLDARSREQRAFRLTRDGFSLVVMGFTGAEATAWKVKYISAFNTMADEVSRLAAPAVDLTGIQKDIDALIMLVADIEARVPAPSLPAPTPVQVFSHLPRMLRRKMERRERRRAA